MEQKHNIDDSVYIEAYYRLKTIGKIAHELGVPDVTVWRRCKKLGLSFKNGGQNKDKRRNQTKFLLEDILNGLHPQYPTVKLKNRLIKENKIEYKCSLCSIKEWNSKELTLHLDHIDGNPKNHNLNNLRLLCPNCHSQTDTWCGKNK